MAQQKQSAMIFIMFTLLIDCTGFGIIIPVLPNLIKEFTGGSTSVAADYGGYLMVAFALPQFIFSPILGGLSDQYGRRPILLFSLFGLGMDYLLLSFAPSIFWFFIGRIIAGITGASFTTGMAYIADISTPEKKAQNFGLVGAAFGLGFILGSVGGGLLSSFGLRVPFMVAAGLSLLNWLYGYFILPESLAKEKRRKFSWKRANPVGSFINASKYPAILGLLATLLLLYIASHSVQSNWSYYVIEKFQWTPKMIGYSLAVVGIMVALVQGGLIRIVIPKIGNRKAIYIGLILYVIGFLCFAFAKNGTMMMLFIIPYCLAGIGGPAMQSIISNQVPENAQGEIQGITTSLQSLAAIIGPWLVSHIFVYFIEDGTPLYFPGAPFILSAFLTLIGLFIAIRALRKYH
ncbi:DHA1 family tetracycline resistance protein-like MFS transporter [Pedobacter psychrotolerans]|uniref:DHA1 family tetracycline resistance protein-like MFS transporter n=1 Tax=Pedobacter psychrotolerans TaxID=1843235 RepID=A0A4R2H879_9SPHI|nr:TCR/Tet family MFS transporter [Pedobacter psychrotolerans]TCO22449.1 DHA1 family tetracycline resistance protein-like MFS transporter [Pedobacter psychrotolerans]GGE64644.1 tetracycline resistance MFS efflux pump [Pedobacter psychrotolerans]